MTYMIESRGLYMEINESGLSFVFGNGTTAYKFDDDLFYRKEFNNCEQLIGESAQKLINTFMKWIRIIVPILLIVFGIIDFATAVFSSKEDDMKKRRETFIKRIVAAVLVFLAPILVNLLLNKDMSSSKYFLLTTSFSFVCEENSGLEIKTAQIALNPTK